MATFKVGRRVKKIANAPEGQAGWIYPASVPLGAQGTVGALPGTWGGGRDDTYGIEYDGLTANVKPFFAATPEMLSPLTDPGFDAFLERIQKPIYDEPKVERVEEKQ